MIDYAALKAALAGLPDDPAQAAAALAAQTSTVTVDIPTGSARAVILVSGEWFRVKQLSKMALSGQATPTAQDVAIAAADSCVDTFTLTDVIETSKPEVWAAVQGMMAVLHGAGVVSDSTVAAWTAMRNRTVPAWPGLTPGDVQTARNQP